MRIHTISERELECDECRPYSTKSRGGIVTCSKMEGAHSFKLSVKSVFNNSRWQIVIGTNNQIFGQ